MPKFELSIDIAIQYIFLCASLLSLKATFVRFIHVFVTSCILGLLHFYYCTVCHSIIAQWVYPDSFNHFSVEGCWSCEVRCGTSMDILAHVFWWTYLLISVVMYFRVIELVCLTLVDTDELFSKVAGQIYTPINGVQELQLLHITPTCNFWLHFNFSHLSGCTVYHIAALIFIFWIANKAIFHLCIGHSCFFESSSWNICNFSFGLTAFVLLLCWYCFCSLNLFFSDTCFAHISSHLKTCLFTLIMWSFHSWRALFYFYLKNL